MTLTNMKLKFRVKCLSEGMMSSIRYSAVCTDEDKPVVKNRNASVPAGEKLSP